MKRQYIETVACLSLVAYAALVLAAQAAHWIPGWGCGCHKTWNVSTEIGSIDLIAADYSARSNPQPECGSSDESFQPSRIQTDDSAAVAEHGDCLLCVWFSMAQENLRPPSELTTDAPYLFEAPFLIRDLQELQIGSVLPRGPPLC